MCFLIKLNQPARPPTAAIFSKPQKNQEQGLESMDTSARCVRIIKNEKIKLQNFHRKL
jgi:hypothetical protein